MSNTPGVLRPPAGSMKQTQTPLKPTPDATNTTIDSSISSPISSASPTLNLNNKMAELQSQRARSPRPLASPKPPSRRTSNTTGSSDRPTSSPALLKRSSRSSLGGREEEELKLTPKRSISSLITGLREAHSRMEPIDEPTPLTAAEIAVGHFTRALRAHTESGPDSEAVVILHDACYGHRYSRPRTTKATLSMIVERPERLHASVLGISAAYVRLGGHHVGGRHAPHPGKSQSDAPPFKVRRTGRAMDITSSCITNVHGSSWMSELHTMCRTAGQRLAAGEKELNRSPTTTEPPKRHLHEGDLYLSTESLSAFQGALGGVADAVDAVFDPTTQMKRAFAAVRPPGHHCSADYPSGFCWINNVHVGIEYAAQTHGLTHAAIIDFDLHHGDGSQAIAWERNSTNNTRRLNAKPNSRLKLGPDIGYYSLHDINSYPCESGDDDKVQAASLCIENAHSQSIWNVHLQPWKTEAEFWQLYDTRYCILLDKARAFLRHHTARIRTEGKTQPKAAIFVSAGFDASEWEGAGMQRHKVNVPTEFYARFTRDLVELVQEEGTGCGGRLISVLEGGYSDRALCSGVLSHLSGLCATSKDVSKIETANVASLDQMMRGLGIDTAEQVGPALYDKTWWSAENLTALELKVNPPAILAAKKVRIGPQPTYATPTESFAYKVTDVDKFARSISGTMREAQRPARPPTPPPPEVDWVVSTQELSKLLIPNDRQTRSCTAEELTGSKTRKEHSSPVPNANAEDVSKPRQLRDRKSKLPAYPDNGNGDGLEKVRSVSSTSRRQTIADFPLTSASTASTRERRPGRRMSASSVLSSVADELQPPLPPLPVAQRQASAAVPASRTTAGVQIKKTRAPVKGKRDATASANASPARSAKLSAGVSTQPTNAPTTSDADVEALTSTMKRVTIKVGTKEEHDRKLKEKVDAERRARALKAAETRKANAAAKKALQSLSHAPVKDDVEQTLPHIKENTAPLSMFNETKPSLASKLESSDKGHPQVDAAPTVPEITSSTADTVNTAHNVPALISQPTQETHPQPTTWLEPHLHKELLAANHDTPSHQTFEHPSAPDTIDQSQPPAETAAKERQTQPQHVETQVEAVPLTPPSPSAPRSATKPPPLPIFSSTSIIPFSTTTAVADTTVTTSTTQPDDVTTTNSSDARKEAEKATVNAVGARKSPRKVAASIWDVPETPER